MIQRLAGISSGRRSKWVVVAAWLVLLGIFGPLGARIGTVTNDDVAPSSGSQSARVSDLLRHRFGSGETRVALLVYRRPGGLTRADRAKILADAERAARIPLVAAPTPAFSPRPVPGLVSRTGDVAFTVVPLIAKGRYEVVPTINALRKLRGGDPGLEVHVTGDAALLSDVKTALRSGDRTLLLVTVVLVLLLLIAVYRSPVLALVPLAIVGIAYSVTSGILYLAARAGMRIDTTVISVLLVLMFGAGTDYCLLLVARYRSELRRLEDKHEALARALTRAGPAMLASGATVALSLLAMLASLLGGNRSLGPVNAIGIVVVLTAGLTLLPAVLAIVGRRGFWPGGQAVAFGFVTRWFRQVARFLA